VVEKRDSVKLFIPPLCRRLLRNLLAPLWRHIRGAGLPAKLSHLSGGTGNVIACIFDFASSNLADHNGKPNRIGWALLSVGAFRHGVFFA
jgi:hypothetical protein